MLLRKILSLSQALFATFFFLGVTTAAEQNSGCTAPFLLPNKPFVVVWNHPSQTCESRGIKLDFTKWGIVDNSGDYFIGEEISLLYGPGRWPSFSGSVPINGGLPQLSDLAKHLDALEQLVNSKIPNASFSGLGVIDMEFWRPIMSLNFDKLRVYQDQSVALAHQKFPQYNKTQLYQEATREFNKAARAFMEDTLSKLHKIRPAGKWGYYGYPRCWDSNCNTSTISINDQMSWVFSNSSGLYPRIYFNLKSPPSQRAVSIKQNVGEALRVKAKYGYPAMPVLPYAFCQDTPYEFYNASALDYAIKEPADMGASGVVLWGGSGAFHAKNECQALQHYLETTLGPYSQKITNFFADCSMKICSSHGRCVRKDLEAVYQRHLNAKSNKSCRISKESLMPERERSKGRHNDEASGDLFNIDKPVLTYGDGRNIYDDYVCKCAKGWEGEHCDHKTV